MIVVDTSVWIDHFRNDETPAVQVLRGIKPRSGIIVGDLIMVELLQGARNHRNADDIELSLREFAIAPMMSEVVVQRAARIYRELRANGITIRKTVDLIIATFCIVNGHHLLQDDRDFRPIAERFDLRLA